MADLTDFVGHGYQVVKELGHNLEGGRFTYLAKRLADNVDVVIKQFQFSKGAGWDGFKAIEREMQSLQGLNHRGIPKYLDKFETDSGYCLVTEYFPADTLAVGRSFTPDQIKQIAVQLLEILVYLQERMPPVIHRDVKPENILVDDNLNVYLIDFGFARVGSGSVAMSSANAGTFGFMAPEQIRNLKLTNASDLYGLGLTLICLIGAIRSTDIGNYIDFSNQLDRSKIDPKLKGCSLTFVKWLDQMVAPDPSKRFADAKTASEALKPLYVVRVPSVKLSRSSLGFTATKLGEKLTQTITLSNSIPETVLEGRWEIEPHPNDPPHTPNSHDWISFSSNRFKGNQIECQIMVDTSKLIAQANGTRSILLQTNAVPENYTIPIEVVTAPLPLEAKKMPYLAAGIYLLASVILGYFVGLAWNGNIFGVLTAITLGYFVGVGIFAIASISGDKSTISENKFFFQDVLSDNVARLANQSILAGTLVFLFVAPFVMPLGKAPINVSMAAEAAISALIVATNLTSVLFGNIVNISTISTYVDRNTNARFKGILLSFLLLIASYVFVYVANLLNYTQLIYWNLALSCVCSWLMTTASYHSIHGYLKLPEPNRCNEKVFNRILILSMFCGSYIGFCLKVGFFINIFVSLGTLGLLGLLGLLVFILFNPSLQHKRAISAYRRKEEHLIKP